MLKQRLNSVDELDSVFHALADPTRRAIVQRLGQGAASVSELAQPFAMSLSAVVQHIQILEASGIIQTEKLGRSRVCRVDPVKLRSARDWIGHSDTQAQPAATWRPEIPTIDEVRRGVFCLD